MRIPTEDNEGNEGSQSNRHRRRFGRRSRLRQVLQLPDISMPAPNLLVGRQRLAVLFKRASVLEVARSMPTVIGGLDWLASAVAVGARFSRMYG
jgi:hypothetical protein